jgi:hypothetical protein
VSARWAAVEAVLRKIEPNLDATSLAGIKVRLDPDKHRDFFARTEHPYMSRWQIDELRKVLEPALSELRQISPQAWAMLRLTALQQGTTIPTSPTSPHLFAPPSLVEHLEALLAAADKLGRPPPGVRPRLMVECAVAGVCAAVYFDLRRKPPTTSHPDQRTARPEPYHDLVEAVFEGWGLSGWRDRAPEAAIELRAAVQPKSAE